MVTDLRKAAEMALEALELSHPRFGLATEKYKQAIKALRQALEKDADEWYEKALWGAEQEPVAYEVGADVINSQGQPEYRTFIAYRPDPTMTTGGYEVTRVLEARPLYTAPPSIEAAVLAEREAWDGACVLGHCTSPAGCEDSNCCRANYNAPVDAVPGFTATEPRQSLSRMKPGDRFVLVRTSEIYHIKKDGSQWNDTRQRPARLHKNSQVRLIVTHPKCDDACMNICTEGFTKPPTCNTPVDAVNMSQERVDETAKGEHEPLVWMNKYGHVSSFQNEEYKDPLYTAPPKREWVGLTADEIWKCNKAEAGSAVEFHICVAHQNVMDFAEAIEQALKEKNGG